MNHLSTDAMPEPGKDLHLTLPQTLVAQMEQTAETASMTLDELVQKAVQGYIADRSWTRLRAYAEAQAQKVGITTEADVERAVHEFRKEESERQNKERGD